MDQTNPDFNLNAYMDAVYDNLDKFDRDFFTSRVSKEKHRYTAQMHEYKNFIEQTLQANEGIMLNKSYMKGEQYLKVRDEISASLEENLKQFVE